MQKAFYIPSLDGIRAASVLLVFLAHAGLDQIFPGQFGVTVFFFLSGYLITTLLRLEYEQTGAISLRAFYLRRALRILPPMYLVLGIASALTFVGALEGSLRLDAVLMQVFHLSNYYVVYAGWWDGRAPGTWIYWSLAVEEHFYLVFPLSYLLLQRLVPSRRRQVMILLGTCAAVLAWRLLLVYGLHVWKERTYVATDTRMDSILFGCVLAVYGNPMLDRSGAGERWWKMVWLPLGLAGLLVSFIVRDAGFQETWRYSLQGVALVPLFVVAIRYPEWGVCRLLNVSWVKYIGVLSYVLYLAHPTILFALHQWTGWPAALVGIGGLALSLGAAAAVHHYVEQPCARLRKRLSRIGVQPRRSERTLQPMNVPVSAVICTRNRPDLIGNAVASVLANTYPTFNLLVVDQSDDGRTGDVVRALIQDHPNGNRLCYLHTSTPGLSRAYNIGIRETIGEVLAFTDDDCIAPPDWIESIVEAFRAEPDGEMLYGQVLLPEALAGHADEVPTLGIARPRRLSRRDGFQIYGMGANFAARRSLFRRVGGFDEILGGGGQLRSSQDFDFQYRAYRAGATVLLRPEVKVDHYGVRSRDQWPATLRAYGVGDGAFYFKHVRCGDLFALSLMIRRLGRVALREAVNGIRRKPSLAVYLRSYLEGMRESLRFPVDRSRRLYLMPSRAA